MQRKFHLILLFVMLAASCYSFSQEAVVTRTTAYLRADPSTNEAPEATLHSGDLVTLLDLTPEHGYYQVKTTNGKDGWVFSRSIHIIASPSSNDPNVNPDVPESTTAPHCDDTLWNHVYHAHRLIIKQACLTVTGTVVDATNGRERDGVRHEADGDTHGWLKVDPQFVNLLNPGNMHNEGGNLVFEIVCKFPVTQADAVSACSNFHDPVAIPPVGSRVQIVGTYVRDTNHAQWMEIHPVSSITVLH